MRDARCAIQAQGKARRHAWLLVRIAPEYLVMHRWESPLPQITLQLLPKLSKRLAFDHPGPSAWDPGRIAVTSTPGILPIR